MCIRNSTSTSLKFCRLHSAHTHPTHTFSGGRATNVQQGGGGGGGRDFKCRLVRNLSQLLIPVGRASLESGFFLFSLSSSSSLSAGPTGETSALWDIFVASVSSDKTFRLSFPVHI